jgi:hypothetical protein
VKHEKLSSHKSVEELFILPFLKDT